MPRSSYYIFRLTRLFPPNDEYAATMARLCILWEDFITEATGGAATSIKEMDGHSPQWRRLYFLRRSIATIYEILDAMRCLHALEEFRQALNKQPKPDKDCFVQSNRILRRHKKRIDRLRNAIAGGHVDQLAVKEGLARLNSDATGIFQQGEIYKDIRFKFAHPIVLETFFKDSKAADAEEEMDELLNFMHEVVGNASKMIEFVFSVYVKQRAISPL